MKQLKNALIGSLLILLLNSSSCKKTESLVYKSEFNIVNETDKSLSIKSWLNNKLVKTVSISENSTFQSTESAEQPLTAAQFWDSDSLELIFEDKRHITYTWYRPSPTLNNILTTGWTAEKVDERYTKRIYTITQEHSDSAR